MSRIDRIALLLSLIAVLAAYLVGDRVFERLPHLEDEIAYTWQAQVYARGELTVPSPPHPKSMMIPFVVDYRGQRFAKYPPGWPLLLAMGILIGVRSWVNPLLAGLGLWLTYRLGQKVLNSTVGLLAAILTLTSPFFLLNSGSLLAHPWSLALSLGFVLSWLDTFDRKVNRDQKGVNAGSMLSGNHCLPPPWLTALIAGLSLGLLALTRPLTAIGVGLPFAVHGLILLVRGGWDVRRRVLLIGGTSMVIGALVFAWQYAVTGNPMLNPYVLWWPYDKVGFGPGYGRQAGGHSLYWGWVSLKNSLRVARGDLFGWGKFSWIFLPFGLWALRRERTTWLLVAVFPSLMLVYMTYWIGSSLYGPRYYYEGLYSLTLVSAAGILWLANDVVRTGHWRRIFQAGAVVLLAMLLACNLVFYLHGRLGGMYGLYGIRRERLEPFLTAEARTLIPAVVVVHIKASWTDYGTLLDMEDPWLTTPFIFALSRPGVADAALAQDYPDRRLIYYYPDEANKFYRTPRN